MSDVTHRLSLPLLAAGQAQKEILHNEALALVDMLVQPVVLSAALSAPPSAPQLGQCWIVATGPTGAWLGKADQLACWTHGGWRFVAPFAGMRCWNGATQAEHRYEGSAWTSGMVKGNAFLVNGTQVVGSQQSAIAPPAGGAVIDSEARIALSAILASLRSHGLIAN